MNLAPIVLFVYNRPWHTEQTLNALAENELAKDSTLYIYADGVKENTSKAGLEKIRETRELIQKKKWCKEVYVIESGKNKGLANSVIDGVSEIVKKYGKIIVLEDDLITSKGFLKYMNDALLRYENELNIMQISGHCFPIDHIQKNNSSFFVPLSTSWGWGTWKRAWDIFDSKASGYEILKSDEAIKKEFDLKNSFPYSSMLIKQMESGKIDSWSIRWWWTIFKKNGIALFPDKSLVKNIGFGIESTHTQGSDPFFLKDFDQNYYIHNFPETIQVNDNHFEEITKHLRFSKNKKQSPIQKNHSVFHRIIMSLWSYLFK
jgi:GT2 family glycosyltransferase